MKIGAIENLTLGHLWGETGTYSCLLFAGRCACLISGRRQAPTHACCCWQVCLSDIREETGTYSCLLFVSRCACLISGRRQAPIHAFCLLAGVPVWSGRRQAPIHAFCLLAGVLPDFKETGTYSCFLFVGRCACLISRRQAPIHAFCLLAGVPVWYQGGDRHLFILSVCWQVCLSDIREETGTYSSVCWQVCLSDIRE